MLAVLARARIHGFNGDHQGQAEDIIEFAIGRQSGVGRDFGTVEVQLQAAVEISLRAPSFDSLIGEPYQHQHLKSAYDALILRVCS